MKKQTKKTKKRFNESFVDTYANSSLSAYDLEPKIHAEVDPTYANAIAKAKQVRERMKDEFKEQEETVKEFLDAQELVEKPKIKSTAELKAMKLAENKMSGNGKRSKVVNKRSFVENRKSSAVNENVKKNLTEDYSNFIGKPLKDFLFYIYRRGQNNPRVNIEYENDSMGMSGFSGVTSDVPFIAADKVIKDIFLGDNKYYEFKVITEGMNEARKAGSTGGIEGFQYFIVSADENNKHKKITKAKGVEKLLKAIAKADDKSLNDAGKTQLYAYREGENPDNPVYFKVANDDGTWDVLVDNIENERPVEERKTLFNCVQADLISDSSPEVKRLRKVPRPSDGIGFEPEEVGFRDDKFILNTVSDKSIEWAKTVADAYGLKTSDVVEKDNGRKYIQIYAPGAEKEMMSQK